MNIDGGKGGYLTEAPFEFMKRGLNPLKFLAANTLITLTI